MRLKFVSVPLALAALAGCATRPPAPADLTAAPAFQIERDLAGKTVGRGSFSAITGVERGFEADLNGTWDGAVLTLVEDFRYDDGETDQKTWRLTKLADGSWSGVREDVVGTARGYQDGAAFRLEYKVRLGGRVVGFRDVLALGPNGVIINDATVGWRGVRVGRVRLEIERAD